MYGPPRHPDYPAALAKIQNLSSDELKEYLNNDNKMDEFIKSLDQIKQLYAEKEMIMASNKSLAEYNLSQEPILTEKRDILLRKHKDAVELANVVKRVRSDLESKAGKVQPDTLLALLQAANAEAEEESENLAEAFLRGGEKNVEEFLDKFQEIRKVAHLRRVKIDKMKELLEKKKQGGGKTTPNRRAPPPPSKTTTATPTPPPPAPVPANSWGSPSSSLPYPVHPNSTPMLPPIPVYPPLPR